MKWIVCIASVLAAGFCLVVGSFQSVDLNSFGWAMAAAISMISAHVASGR